MLNLKYALMQSGLHKPQSQAKPEDEKSMNAFLSNYVRLAYAIHMIPQARDRYQCLWPWKITYLHRHCEHLLTADNTEAEHELVNRSHIDAVCV